MQVREKERPAELETICDDTRQTVKLIQDKFLIHHNDTDESRLLEHRWDL